MIADDAAELLRALEVPSADVACFSMGSAIAQELALRHPELVRSLVLVSTYARPDELFRAQLNFWRWLPEAAPSEHAFYEAFLTWVYTPRAHVDGTVEQIVEEALAFPHQQSVEAFQAQVDACLTHDTVDRLPQITAPTLVLAGELDVILPPRFGRFVADAIPNGSLRGHAGRGAPALPGGAGRVQRPRRRLLERGRGARVTAPSGDMSVPRADGCVVSAPRCESITSSSPRPIRTRLRLGSRLSMGSAPREGAVMRGSALTTGSFRSAAAIWRYWGLPIPMRRRARSSVVRWPAGSRRSAKA